MLATIAVVGILYGALAALAQTDVKRLVAYSSVSHMGFIALGIFCDEPDGRWKDRSSRCSTTG